MSLRTTVAARFPLSPPVRFGSLRRAAFVQHRRFFMIRNGEPTPPSPPRGLNGKVSPLMLRAISEIAFCRKSKASEATRPTFANVREPLRGSERASFSVHRERYDERSIGRNVRHVRAACKQIQAVERPHRNKLEHYYYGNCIVKVIAPASISVI